MKHDFSGSGMRFSLWVVLTVVLATMNQASAETWQHLGKIGDGGQYNATIGTDGNIHIISDRYIRVSTSGQILETVDSVSDERMGGLDFWPAIAAGPDGTIHIVTRHGGSWTAGHTLRYRKRSASGVWSAAIQMASAVPRNYSVGCAVTTDGVAWAVHGEATGNNVSRPRFYKITNNTVTYLGNFASQNYHRPDVGIRFVADGNALVMASAYHWPGHPMSLFKANAGNTLHSDLESSRWTATTGDSRVSFPAIYVHGDGAIDLSYGAITANEAYFCRYNSDKTAVRTNVLALDNMSKWHCGEGCAHNGLPPLTTIAASADKQKVLVVGIVGDETEPLANGPLVYALSTNGGASFGARVNVGKNIHAGDGRRLPILLIQGNVFYLVYRDNAVGGVSLSKFALVASTDPAVGLSPTSLQFTANEDDAANPASQDVTISNVGAGVRQATGVYCDSRGMVSIVITPPGDHHYQVFSLKGTHIASGWGTGATTYSIDAARFPAGVYVTRIVTPVESVGKTFTTAGK